MEDGTNLDDIGPVFGVRRNGGNGDSLLQPYASLAFRHFFPEGSDILSIKLSWSSSTLCTSAPPTTALPRNAHLLKKPSRLGAIFLLSNRNVDVVEKVFGSAVF